MNNISIQFLKEFKPFSINNMDKIFDDIQDPDNPILAKFNINFFITVFAIFSVFNLIFSFLYTRYMDVDTTMKFISSITFFIFNSFVFMIFLYQIYKARVNSYFFEIDSLTRNIKKNYFYNSINLQEILKEIPLSISYMNESKYKQFINSCNQHCLANQDIQMIANMLEYEIFLTKKNQFTLFVKKIFFVIKAKLLTK